MAVYTVFSVLFGRGAAPIAWVILSFCLLIGAAVQLVALKRGRNRGQWLFPMLLVLLWFMLELVTPQTANYAQIVSLTVLMFAVSCLLGAVLGTALFYLVATVRAHRGKKKDPENQ